MNSPKTTLWGILGAVGLLLGAIVQFHNTGHFDANVISLVLAALGIGGAGIAAKDNSKT
jgi:hypothetical protein